MGGWLLYLNATGGSKGIRQALAERRNPYSDLYRGAVNRLTAGVVPPARTGEAIAPHIRFEQPWNQGLALLIGLGGAALIVWLYRHEGSVPGSYKALLATLRIVLVLLAMFLLSEAVLSVDRTGLPYFVVMVDDSASTSVVDAYPDSKRQDEAAALAKTAQKPSASRLAVAQGWLERNRGKLLQELQKQHRVRLYLVSSSARPLGEIASPQQVRPTLDQLERVEPIGDQSRLGDGVRQVLTELRGAPPTAILLLTDGQTTDGESLVKAAEFARHQGRAALPDRPGRPVADPRPGID